MAEHASKNGTTKVDVRLGALRSELETLEADMKGLANDVEAVADNRVHVAIRKAEDVAHRAYRLAEESATQATDDVEAWAGSNLNSARKSIRAQPLSALALSLGAGALIGAIFGVVRRGPPDASA